MHDHRKLGRELELFDTDPLIGAGLPYWLPAGAAIRHGPWWPGLSPAAWVRGSTPADWCPIRR